MAKIDLTGVWSLTCDKPDFGAIPARIPGDNCSALIDAGLAADPNVGFNENDIQWVRQYDWNVGPDCRFSDSAPAGWTVISRVRRMRFPHIWNVSAPMPSGRAVP